MLVTCPGTDCRVQYSSRLSSCPKCGTPALPHTTPTNRRPSLTMPIGCWTGLGLLSLFFLCCLFLLPATDGHYHASRRSICKNNLKQTGLALHNYHDRFGSFPPAVVNDASGRPAHSWRVLILPWLDASDLYQRYRFNEPWDGPHNSQLASEMPEAFRCPGFAQGPESHTNYVVVTDDNSVFPGDRSIALREITDGATHTLLAIEVRQHAVHWMQPDDCSQAEIVSRLQATNHGEQTNHGEPGAGAWPFVSAAPGGWHWLMADGTVRFQPNSLSPEAVRALITRNGNEQVSPDDL